MSHEVESIAYAGELPWHGLGNKVDPNVTTMEMLDSAGLNWKVEKRQLLVQKSSGEIVPVHNRFALVRETDEKVLTMVGHGWNPVQNEVALNFFREYAEAGKLTLETAGSLRKGRVIWALAKMNASFEATAGDKVDGYILLMSHHEIGHCTSAITTTVRVVCANTMALALRSQHELHWKQNHMSEFDVSAAQAAVEAAHGHLSIAERQAHVLIQISMTELDTVRILGKFFQPMPSDNYELLLDPANQNKVMKEVLASVANGPGAAPSNAWGVLQGVTHWADHIAGRSVDARMTRAWIGDRANLKLTVNDALLSIAA